MIYIVRHGQTDLNINNALQGRSNHPLNEVGKGQALESAKFFKDRGIVFDKVYSSPLIRAVQTAKLIVGEDCEIVTDERLIEMDYGPYEGMTLENPPQEIITFFSDFVHNPAPDGMEQLSSVVARMGEFLEEIADQGDKNILISAHAISMKGALEYLTPESGGSYWSKYIGNCSVYKAACENGVYEVPTELV